MSQQLQFFKKDIDQSAPKQLKEFEPLLNKLKMKDKDKWNVKKVNNNLKYVIPVYKRCIFIFFLICEVHEVKSRQADMCSDSSTSLLNMNHHYSKRK